ncbi:MotA/TolQ/ExbB proton channel family protein [Hyphomicrobium sp.]|uniref:MotA/TolQ/ExbB proton channel family protein n=1 Tax=Hyphomicrobium sp. TaxID=82 RepID=UPI002FDCDD55
MLDTVESRATAIRKEDSRAIEAADPVLSWLIFATVNLLTFVLLWFYGLAEKALTSDPTYITLFIMLIYVATSLHCLSRCLAISREAEAEKRLAASISSANDKHSRILEIAQGSDSGGGNLDNGLVADHIRNLVTTSKLSDPDRKFDQTLLLRVLAERLSGSNSFGAFASDLAMKLGLFGTIVGFIMMLAPIAGFNAEDQAAIKSSMPLMGEGMAVAMYTTLAGLVASILIKIQYQFVENATARIFTSAVALTEVHVVPVLERQAGRAR